MAYKAGETQRGECGVQVFTEEAASDLLGANVCREYGSQWGRGCSWVCIRGMRTCAKTGPVGEGRGQAGKELQGLLFKDWAKMRRGRQVVGSGRGCIGRRLQSPEVQFSMWTRQPDGPGWEWPHCCPAVCPWASPFSALCTCFII